MTKAHFLGPLDLRAYSNKEWVGLAPLPFQSADGTVYTVPKWFISDLASIPWICKPVFNTVEDREPGHVHDWLYCSQLVPREVADALLFEMLIANGCDLTRARLIYAGVRIGGAGRYAQCAGGVKVEDLAFELMTESERACWAQKLSVHLTA